MRRGETAAYWMTRKADLCQVPLSRHHRFLRWIPLFDSTPALMYQRKVTLHGVRARETPEDVVEREIRKELRAVLPYLFSGEYRNS